MKIYTKHGDAGLSVLFDGTRAPKNHPRLETYGTLDELHCHLGLAAAASPDDPLRAQLAALQVELFDLASDLATPAGSKNESKVRRISPADVANLERQIDAATAELPPLKRFILPGGTPAAGHLHVARTVCRRAERHLVTLMSQEPLAPDVLIYLNRLSDLLFTLARLANLRANTPDVERPA